MEHGVVKHPRGSHGFLRRMIFLTMLLLLFGCGPTTTVAPSPNRYVSHEDATKEAAWVGAPIPPPTTSNPSVHGAPAFVEGSMRKEESADEGLGLRTGMAYESAEEEKKGGSADRLLPRPTSPPLVSALSEHEPGEPAALGRPQGRPAPLKAGERDDNELFPEYLEYLRTYAGPPARIADVTDPMVIKVTNSDQVPLLDATVKMLDEQQAVVFVGKTYAGGQTIFFPYLAFPRVHGGKPRTLQLIASYGNETIEKTVVVGERNVELIFPRAKPVEEVRLDVLFLLDTTGSMADELSHIQEHIVSIAQRIDQMEPRPTLRLGLVAYRDRGDEYVTRKYDFSPNVSDFRRALNSFSAGGGGDEPESLNEALHEAVQGMRWATDHAVRLIFLVADAGPHLDYENDYDYLTETREAVAKGIKIYPIAASNTNDFAEYVFRQLAQQTMARFVFLTYQEGKNEGPPGEHTTLASGDQPYTVQHLDELIVNIVRRELAAVRGQR